MRRKRKGGRRPLLRLAAGRAAATGACLARRIGRLVIDRAVKQTGRHSPADARLLHDIGLGPDAEPLASLPQVLAADPDQISLKPNSDSRTRCQ
jgi:hypothetical protein